jgi:hypothetical protein
MPIEPGDSVLYMKVGTHAKEGLPEIYERKRREIEDEGYAMWGYGGNTCHPTSMVQPFAHAAAGPIKLVMQPMNSKHLADQLRAKEYSADGKSWSPIPAGINVLGSRYALCIDSLDQVDEMLNLAETRVAVGNSRGRNGLQYVRGRVDKACLEVVGASELTADPVRIGLTARVIEPYAVLLRA